MSKRTAYVAIGAMMAIFLFGAAVRADNTHLIVTSCSNQNSSLSSDGGTLYIRGSTSGASGGAVVGLEAVVADQSDVAVEYIWSPPGYSWSMAGDSNTWLIAGNAPTASFHDVARAPSHAVYTVSCSVQGYDQDENWVGATPTINIDLTFLATFIDYTDTWLDYTSFQNGEPNPSGFSFIVETDAYGSGLQNAFLQQVISTTTGVTNWDGSQMSQQQIVNLFPGTFSEAIESQNALDRGLNPNGNPPGTWRALDWVSNDGSSGYVRDLHYLWLPGVQVGADNQIYRETSTKRSMTLEFEDNASNNLGSDTWGFSWTNTGGIWLPSEAPTGYEYCTGGPNACWNTNFNTNLSGWNGVDY